MIALVPPSSWPAHHELPALIGLCFLAEITGFEESFDFILRKGIDLSFNEFWPRYASHRVYKAELIAGPMEERRQADPDVADSLA